MPKKATILFVGGGSGGHIIPNLCIASALNQLAPDTRLIYAGSRNGLDADIVRGHQTHIHFIGLITGKWRRYFSWQNFIDPFVALVGFFQSLWIMVTEWPAAIVATGGYISLPIVCAGWIFRRPIFLHESDSIMGLANRLAARLATHVSLSFPDTPSPVPATWVGQPVRSSITHGNAPHGWQVTGLVPGKPVVLVMGGSLGAQRINELIVDAFPLLRHEVHVVHITGAGKETPLRAPGYVQFPYLGDGLASVYAITDVMVARAGANTLAEIALLAKPSVVLPLPDSAQDNQQKNAEYYQRHGAAIVLSQSGLTPETLADTIFALVRNPAQRKSMEDALHRLSTPHAAQKIAKIIMGCTGRTLF